ncbi:unnamed protein product [Sphagnum jensenii]|uniref:Homeodomain-like superfamily protein n=1 Tax=Sphagnum jensenii TaxID=128206 RepID=A0ABP1AEA3_9BRYO
MQEIIARDVGVAIFDGARMETVPDMQPKIGDSVMSPAARKDGSFEEGSEASQCGFQKPCQIADAGQSVISNLERQFWSLQRGAEEEDGFEQMRQGSQLDVMKAVTTCSPVVAKEMKPDEGQEEQGNTGDTEHGTPGGSVDPEDEDEEGDVDFNPFLQHSPSQEPSSGASSDGEEGEELDGQEVEEVAGDREGLNKQERQRLSASIFDYGSRSAGFQVGEETVMGHTLENLPDQQSPSSETCAADTSQHSTEEEGTVRDAISKRTRAHYSLADMSLDQLETFLQESDEEDYFQNVDDEEEYRKFLAAVQEKIDMQEDENKQEKEIDEEEESEDEDADFEVEIEEALESDDEGLDQEGRKRKRPHRPETREKRRQRAKLQNKVRLLGLAKTPLRPLLPYTGSMPANSSIAERTKIQNDRASKGWLSNAKQRPPVNGFTAHQIGQLYCLIHEHVQLLLQVFSLCILEPARQQMAIDTHRMLMELVEKRESILAWKKSAFPDFCFHPPYTHPSVAENRMLPVTGQSPLGNFPDASYLPPNNETSGLSTYPFLLEERQTGGSLPIPGSNTLGLPSSSLSFSSPTSEWVPETSGPVRSLVDVAPLALVRDFLADIAQAVQDYRQRHVESGAYHAQCEREPMFSVQAYADQGMTKVTGQLHQLQLHPQAGMNSFPKPTVKKTMAAALVENTKKQSIAFVPKDVAKATHRFLPLFNKALFPHKAPPASTANRLLFTDAEDELLAMGLMTFNTDWKAVQHRYLPTKSMHQIFVRQKNRSSARAPENSIKAVRRMKSSPLTAEEKSCIQEALKVFKYDWSKVWQFCVPHRDPALLPRQWRIALGTQKSYKSNEINKEKRRLYEAGRRQAIAAQKDAFLDDDERRSMLVDTADMGEEYSGEEDGDESEEAYIRDAFLAEWNPHTTTSSLSVGIPQNPDPHGPPETTLPGCLNKLRKAPTPMLPVSPAHPLDPSISPALTVPAPVPSNPLHPDSLVIPPTHIIPHGHLEKQTVKLAPGLPSLKLPPSVRVMSQCNAADLQAFGLSSSNVSAAPQPHLISPSWGTLVEQETIGIQKETPAMKHLSLTPSSNMTIIEQNSVQLEEGVTGRPKFALKRPAPDVVAHNYFGRNKLLVSNEQSKTVFHHHVTSSGDYCSWLQVRGSRQYEKLQNRRNSEAWNQIQCQLSTAQHPHCSTLGSRSQQRVISSSCSSWLGSSSVIPSSFRGFNSTRTHLWKRPIFVSFLCRFADSKQENIITGTMGIVDTTYFSSSGMAFLADLDPDTAKLAIGILGPLFASFNLLFIVRIVMSWYPQLPVGKFPFVIAYAPTEPVLGPTRRLIPPVGGVDVSPVIWLAVLSFVSEILLGQQGLLVLLSQQQP